MPVVLHPADRDGCSTMAKGNVARVNLLRGQGARPHRWGVREPPRHGWRRGDRGGRRRQTPD